MELGGVVEVPLSCHEGGMRLSGAYHGSIKENHGGIMGIPGGQLQVPDVVWCGQQICHYV